MLIISNGLNAILLTTYLMFFLIFTLGFNYIKILNIDMSGLGITYISQPYFFKIINSRIMQKRYEIDFNSVEKINVENEYLNKKLTIKLKRKGKINPKFNIPLSFFDKKMIEKLKKQLLNNTETKTITWQ